MTKYRIEAKYNETVFCPVNALEDRFFRTPGGDGDVTLVTLDGVECSVEFITAWNNSDGRYDAEFDELCRKRFGVPFQSVRSVWVARLSKISDYWYLLKLTRK